MNSQFVRVTQNVGFYLVVLQKKKSKIARSLEWVQECPLWLIITRVLTVQYGDPLNPNKEMRLLKSSWVWILRCLKRLHKLDHLPSWKCLIQDHISMLYSIEVKVVDLKTSITTIKLTLFSAILATFTQSQVACRSLANSHRIETT